jgi:hypothetical protein
LRQAKSDADKINIQQFYVTDAVQCSAHDGVGRIHVHEVVKFSVTLARRPIVLHGRSCSSWPVADHG